MTRPKISIIIVSYNKPDFIEEAISSAKKDVNNIPAEFIVIDDGSDSTVVKKLKQLKTVYDFSLHLNTVNSGPSTCRNKGILMAKGKYIAFLDGDDYWLEGRIDETLKPLTEDSNIDVVFCDALMEINGTLTSTKQSSLMPPPKSEHFLDYLFKRNCINMCAVTMKTSLAKKVMFDESFRSAEDYDFWLRVAATKNRFLFVDKPLVVYRIHSDNLSSKRILSIDSTLAVLDKNSSLASTPSSQTNLKLHRQSLLEERLKDKDSEPLQTLRMLRSVRPLGKRERVVKIVSHFNGRAGKLTRNRMIR
jgi:glycosyltransferase involved in cell wall biosynthesis